MTRNSDPRCFTRVFSIAAGTPAVFAALLALAAPASATEIYANAGSVALKQAPLVSSSWNSVNPNPLSTIQWFVGDPNPAKPPLEQVDGVPVPNQALAPPQSYLPGGAPGALGPVGAIFPGPLTSLAINAGSGQSQAVNLNGIGPAVNASWNAIATGITGFLPGANWHSVTTAQDPWAISASDFANLTGSYDLFFMAGLTGASLDSPDSSLGFDVSYQTGAGTQALLDVSADSSGVQVTEGTLAGLEIYLLGSTSDGPLDVTGSPLSTSAIQTLLQSLSSTGSLSSSVLFGFELNGQPIPTQDLGGGVVAWMNVDGTVSDGASGSGSTVPEPTSLSLLAAGGFLIALGRLGKRKQALQTK